ncbi:hypothetical protein CH249_14010 [Rhodococcus sp. 05-2255-3B1]|uniref:hypothetical protein n=1 Tax=unclassified Rhodococcus (in: high G+C Gram-positive bacteria) TaxID=192944 RepID=UPI000B9BEF62|nr:MULTISPECIES: hypothetical protein [unclassified Rhodococcus (in: high G+C Gram-positive bacteria)]OZE08451.1 hypothetical protein CH250_17305 [Rhodococcus sp. 05-2255-3C]OZE10196.1 hypothetical protein CH249_14010 [Rhodococcus sp. 05-2255-3B1]OZE25074.1 hypothetical protein CH255_00475 [Rhodococcus sp. 05-2255-2A2]OZE90205.1 hypothetical protein CH302_27525 [Rhodococcus sp. 15-2388-1-1a]
MTARAAKAAHRVMVFVLGGRRVVSGSWPLYRILALMLTISGVLQLATGKVPGSVTATQSPEWTDVAYMWMQLVGGAAILVSLTVGRSNYSISLYLERFGAVLVFVSSLVYVLSVVDYNSGPPTSSGVWLVIGFGLYCGFRVVEIARTLHEVSGQMKRRR